MVAEFVSYASIMSIIIVTQGTALIQYSHIVLLNFIPLLVLRSITTL